MRWRGVKQDDLPADLLARIHDTMLVKTLPDGIRTVPGRARIADESDVGSIAMGYVHGPVYRNTSVRLEVE